MWGGTSAPTANGCSTIDRAPPVSSPSILKTTPTPGASPPTRPSPGWTTFSRAPANRAAAPDSSAVIADPLRLSSEQGRTMNAGGADVNIEGADAFYQI